eukprot:g6377.t1
MTKKQGRNRGKKVVENEFDDASTTSNVSQNSERHYAEPFDLMIDALYEKSSARKLEGLTGLLHLLSSDVLEQDCILRGSSLAWLFSSLVRRGRRQEALLAARGFCLLLLTLGRSEIACQIWKTIQMDLGPSGAISSKPPEVKSAVIEVFGIACFVTEDDPFEIQSTMEVFRTLWKHGNAKVIASAIRSWTLNLSSLSARIMSNLDLIHIADELCLLLEHDDSEVKENAGLALVLLYNLNPDLEDCTESDVESSCGSLSTTMSQMSKKDEAKDKMKDLTTSSSRVIEKQRKSRKQRAQTRSTFREICNFMEDGQFRGEKIKLQHGDVLILSSLRKHVQMKFIRSLLSEGFHRHLHNNEFLHEVFDFKPHRSPAAKMTTSEKRFYKSPSSWSSKVRTKERDWDRSQKQVYLQGGY